ncbi:gluconate 2-dehydrogenase subunit 3 family protein [Catalinimonas niigatensis]|uniref:gluconate 2-dehydrogenase subunit 3 family protein n=1 Tax=Catalinimonas niigatensis TaxID=1397264 RepID=UPI002665B91D|nr:gluconate 2-dehydrogenase subunit 3 family protein [Catalinimonas niigatensis]WPP50874.1 gluconate 2-dehydrogenase subunit 3 family protein [Catalinimonas niigatensis]
MEKPKNGMDRRTSLKYMGGGAAALASLTWVACESPEQVAENPEHQHAVREDYELSEADQKLMEQEFFNEHEMQTVTVLANLIIPADDRSGNAEEAGVPEFIEFMMKDQPWHQTGMRGGLRWLDIESLRQFEQTFVSCSEQQQKQLLDQIAYPKSAKPEMSQGVNFFNNFRDFVATGFFTSKIGIEDLQYIGNTANNWQGSPPEVLQKLGVSYDDVDGYEFA